MTIFFCVFKHLKMKPFIILTISLISLLPVTLGDTPTFTELETLTPPQRDALRKFKSSVSAILPHDYMKNDIYLVKWVQATTFSVRKSEEMIKNAIKWREQVKVEEWDDPMFFADLEKNGEFPLFNDGFDREGRPISEVFFGDWNVRSAALQGKIKHLTHYSLRGIERATRDIRQSQAEGKNTTQFILLLNMEGFSVINQACPTCLSLFLGYLTQYEKYWPNTIHRIIAINTPDSYKVILNLVRPVISPATRAAIKVFGADKTLWKPYLDKYIDPTEISDSYDPRGKDRRHL